jgi:hypothetical protein
MRLWIWLSALLLSGNLWAQVGVPMALERQVTVKLRCLDQEIRESSSIHVEMTPEECARYERAGQALERDGEPDMDPLFLLQTGMAEEIYAAHLRAFERAEELIDFLFTLWNRMGKDHPFFALPEDRRELLTSLLLDPEAPSKLGSLDEEELAFFGDMKRISRELPRPKETSVLAKEYAQEVERRLYESLVGLVGQIRAFCRDLTVPDPPPVQKKTTPRRRPFHPPTRSIMSPDNLPMA